MSTESTQTICESILIAANRASDKVAVQYKSQGQWIQKNWQSYIQDIKFFSNYLKSEGIQKGSTIAIISQSRYEWAVTDLASLANGSIVVPIYVNSTPEDIQFILENCGAEMLILENRNIYQSLQKIYKENPTIKKVVSFEKIVDAPHVPSFQKALEMGSHFPENDLNNFSFTLSQVKATDIASILYTSGTTGQPKGVVLTHEQIMSEVTEAFPLCGANADDIALSFLPYAHVLGRIEIWGHIYIGYTLAFAEGMEQLKQNLSDIRPTFLMAVPRIFEKIHTTILSQTQSNPLKHRLFEWALNVGIKTSKKRLSQRSLTLSELAELEIAKKLVLSKITNLFGGRLRFAISGGAPLSFEVALFFHACDILILEGYGLTETTAAICVNTPFNYKFGSVGRPIGDVQIKIADDGEILVKSKKVMKEYFKNPAATQEAFTDGWYKTGDIGEILSGGALKITDRKKDLIKTAGGKYVAPQKLEALIKKHPLIGYAHIHGDQKKYVIAILALDKIHLEKWAQEKNLAHLSVSELSQHPILIDTVRGLVAEVNTHLASYESIKKFYVAPTEFTVESGELTPSLKLKKKFLDSKFKKEIDHLYI